jgi:hypothetical protein
MNDPGHAKVLLHKHQLELWGRKKKIPVSVPTRLATQQFVIKGVLDSKAALVHAASDRLWICLDGKSHEENIADHDVLDVLCSSLATTVVAFQLQANAPHSLTELWSLSCSSAAGCRACARR